MRLADLNRCLSDTVNLHIHHLHRRKLRVHLERWDAHTRWIQSGVLHFRRLSKLYIISTYFFAWGDYVRAQTAQKVAEESRMVKVALDQRYRNLMEHAWRMWEAYVSENRYITLVSTFVIDFASSVMEFLHVIL